MLKWIIFAICIIGVYYLFFKKPKKPPHNSKKQDSIMLECKRCGTYVASEEAIFQDGNSYCSKECAQC